MGVGGLGRIGVLKGSKLIGIDGGPKEVDLLGRDDGLGGLGDLGRVGRPKGVSRWLKRVHGQKEVGGLGRVGGLKRVG